MSYTNTIKYYIATDTGAQYLGFTSNFELAKKLLEEAKKKNPQENWKICYFWD